MDDKMGFRENLKSELTYQGMMVKELASLSGISKHTLDNYLNVRGYMPSADVAVKIARALGVTVEYLVTGNGNQSGAPSREPEMRSLLQSFKQLNVEDREMVIGIIDLYRNRKKTTPLSPKNQ